MKYRALSLWQPWASAIFLPEIQPLKTVETRSYNTNYRGRLYIHATAKTPDKAWLDLIAQPDFQVTNIVRYNDNQDGIITRFWQYMGHLPKGCKQNEGSEAFKRNWLWGDLSSKRFAWILKNPVKFDTAIPAKGSQFFGWDCEKYLPENLKNL